MQDDELPTPRSRARDWQPTGMRLIGKTRTSLGCNRTRLVSAAAEGFVWVGVPV